MSAMSLRGKYQVVERKCGLPGCGRKHLAKGLCRMHYQRARAHGDPGELTPRKHPRKKENGGLS